MPFEGNGDVRMRSVAYRSALLAEEHVKALLTWAAFSSVTACRRSSA